jgi:hypothetical protein
VWVIIAIILSYAGDFENRFGLAVVGNIPSGLRQQYEQVPAQFHVFLKKNIYIVIALIVRCISRQVNNFHSYFPLKKKFFRNELPTG